MYWALSKTGTHITGRPTGVKRLQSDLTPIGDNGRSLCTNSHKLKDNSACSKCLFSKHILLLPPLSPAYSLVHVIRRNSSWPRQKTRPQHFPRKTTEHIREQAREPKKSRAYVVRLRVSSFNLFVCTMLTVFQCTRSWLSIAPEITFT